MNITTRIATAALITFGALTTNVTPAQAIGGCYAVSAADTFETVLQGGGTLQQGARAAQQAGWYNGTDLCWLQVKGKVNQYRSSYPALRSAIN